MDSNNKPSDDAILQLLRGITSVVNGLSGMSNALSDRHGGSGQEGYRHHAELAVNSANTICIYVLASYQKQFGSK